MTERYVVLACPFLSRSQDEVVSTQYLVVRVLARPFHTGQGHGEIFCCSGEMFSIHNDPLPESPNKMNKALIRSIHPWP